MSEQIPSTPASERVREGWESLPGTERAVDYPHLPLPEIKPTSELRVEVTINTPDGRRMTLEEALEYELDNDGLPINYEDEDIRGVWETVVGAMDARLSR